jgi:hypothetical protein
MARSATEFLEALRRLLLTGRALGGRRLRDEVHSRERANAAFEAVCKFLSPCREAELSTFARGVAASATVVVEDVLGHLLLALSGGSHLVQV